MNVLIKYMKQRTSLLLTELTHSHDTCLLCELPELKAMTLDNAFNST